jgi:hypothetical protein
MTYNCDRFRTCQREPQQTVKLLRQMCHTWGALPAATLLWPPPPRWVKEEKEIPINFIVQQPTIEEASGPHSRPESLPTST